MIYLSTELAGLGELEGAMPDGAAARVGLPEASDEPEEFGWDLAVLGARPLRPQDPEMVGKYRIHALLGLGGMGRVYLGRAADEPADEGEGGAESWVAVKVVRPEFADDPEFCQRFRHELAAVRRVETPYVARFVDGDSDADQSWMATEFVPGIALADAVKSGEPLPTSAVWRLTHDLASALIAVHRAGIVHRDIKPSNVLLGTTGAKLIDFGVARAVDLTKVTSTGLNVGTPNYMAPEQARAAEVWSAADMFSLGVLLYFAVSGRVPFGEGVSSSAAVLFRIAFEEPDLSGLEDSRLRDLIVRCLAKDPAERPSAIGVVALAKAAAIDKLWQEREEADWPAALSARIDERSHAAKRKPPVPLPVTPPAEAPPGPPQDERVMSVSPALERPSGGHERRDRSGGRRRGRSVMFAGAAAAAVVLIGLAATLVWGNGDSQASPEGNPSGVVLGADGSPSNGAAASGFVSAKASGKSQPGALAGASLGSASDGSPQNLNGDSGSAVPSDPGQVPSGSAQPSQSAGPTPTPTSVSTQPNAGCTGWNVQQIGSGTAQINPGHPLSLYAGPYSDCQPTGSQVSHGDTLDLWCYAVNAQGARWSYVEVSGKNGDYGWIPNADLDGGGASSLC